MQTIAYGLEYTQFNYKDYSFQVVAPLVYLCHVIFRFLLDYYLLETAVPTMNFGVSAHSLPSPEPISSATIPMLANGNAIHDQEQELDGKILADMPASAPSILPTLDSELPTLNGQQPATIQTNAYSSPNKLWIGSKNARVHHSPPRAGMKLKPQ